MAEHGRHAVRVRRSLRRRVMLIFVVAVVVTALALALSAYYITKTAQDADALDRALDQSQFNLYLADAMLPAAPAEADYSGLVEALQTRGDFATLIEVGQDTYGSGEVTPASVTPELAAKVAEGRIGYQTIEMEGKPTIAVGAEIRAGAATLYFFYPQDARLADLAQLRNILAIAGVVLAVLGALAGYLLARRLLGPVGAASEAAARMSQGDLDIRLPEGRDEFGVLGGSFNLMAENLRAKMQDLEAGQARERRFVADVTHELRTPISSLVGEASLLRAKLESQPPGCPPEVTRIAELVATDIARLRLLVDDLLEISRLDARAAEVVMEPVDIGNFLAQLVTAHGWSREVQVNFGPRAMTTSPDAAEISSEAATAPYEVVTSSPGAPPLRFETGEARSQLASLTDKRRLERILVNLVENALRHGALPVALASRRSDDVVEITVTDSGPGIPPEHLPHVFERFYKADPSRASSPGSGLGLAIARANARLLGGDVTVANLPGHGARFTVTLPLVASPPAID